MGIVPYKANNGYEPISRYAPIAPGNYKSGQALVLAAGKLAAASGEITVLPEGFLA
jgi:hypothetical protein